MIEKYIHWELRANVNYTQFKPVDILRRGCRLETLKGHLKLTGTCICFLCFWQNFLNGKYGHLAPWIGLHRESSEQPWMWTDNTEYNNLYVFRMLFLLLCSCVVIVWVVVVKGERLSHVKRMELGREKPLDWRCALVLVVCYMQQSVPSNFTSQQIYIC